MHNSQRKKEATHPDTVQNDNANILAIIGHELKTPLNAILGFSEMIKNEKCGTIQNQNYKIYANDINHAGLYMLSLIDGLLDISRIENQINRKIQYQNTISVTHIAKECKRIMIPHAKQKNITINDNLPITLPALSADPRAVKQIWLNIIANAIKFSPNDSQITIQAKKTQNDEIQIAVIDQGPGFPKGMQNLTAPFKQGEHTKNNQQNGNGLGLYIVQKLANLHNAKLSIKQKTTQMTKVSVTFPNNRTIINTS